MFVTIYALLYGDYFKLHKRLLESLIKHAPRDKAKVVIWCNTVCGKTGEFIAKQLPSEWSCVFSKKNVPKYEVMRKLFHGEFAPSTEWVAWFDDDSHITQSDWWTKTIRFIEDNKGKGICYFGQPWYVHHLPGQAAFIRDAAWYAGVPFQQHATRSPTVKKPGIEFAQGSYWWLRTDVMKKLDWPDRRLVHNGGDTLLGEAIHQQLLPFHKFHHGVKLNDAKRRGRSDRPAGAKVNTRR